VFEDVAEGGDGAAVGGGGVAEVVEVEGIGEGVGLELETDLDDIEGCDDEAEGSRVKGRLAKALGRDRWVLCANRDIRPATAPAVTTWSREPCEVYQQQRKTERKKSARQMKVETKSITHLIFEAFSGRHAAASGAEKAGRQDARAEGVRRFTGMLLSSRSSLKSRESC
jgi:hypothetical protein